MNDRMITAAYLKGQHDAAKSLGQMIEEHTSSKLLTALREMMAKDLLQSYREKHISRHDVLVRLVECMSPLDAIEHIETIDNERTSS